MRARHLLTATALGLVFAGCVEEGTQSSEQAIVHGSVSLTDDAVVAIMVGESVVCSGVLVTPSIVVTAAHCVPPYMNLGSAALSVFFGADAGGPGVRVAVATSRAFPSWTPAEIANDIGLIALDGNAPTQPMPMLAQPLEMIDPVGESARVVGFGATEAGSVGIRRTGDMVIESIDSHVIALAPTPAATCSGDSGGPLLLGVGGAEMVAGVHSRSNCQSTSLGERVDVHARSFVLDFVEELGGTAECGADGLCADGCADPDPDCLCGEDGMCTDACASPETDPDCSSDLCGLECQAGCQSSGSGGGDPYGIMAALVLAAFALRRRQVRAHA